MKEITTPTISVIVPVYNAEKYLHKCIDSILAQTFTDFELLLINDGSKDNSGVICDDYAEKDKRVRVFHKGNGGVSSARNMGIDNAIGEYICFIDSDDWIEDEYLNSFFLSNINEDKCLILQDFWVDKYGSKSIRRGYYSENFNEKKNVSFFFLIQEVFQKGNPFCKLYNRAIIYQHKIRFNGDIHFGEDLLFLLEYIQHIDVFLCIDRVHYHYIKSDSLSLSNSYSSFDLELEFIFLIKNSVDNLIKKGYLPNKALDQYDNYIVYLIFRCIRGLYVPVIKKTKKKRLVYIKRILIKDHISLILNSKTYTNQCKFFIPVQLIKFKCFSLLDAYFILLYSSRRIYKQLRNTFTIFNY